MQRQIRYARDARARARRNLRRAVVAHGPERAAIFRLTAFPRSQRDPQSDQAAGWAALELRKCTVELAIQAAPESDHGRYREDCKEPPLQPRGQAGSYRQKSGEDGRAANEHEV